MSPEIYEIPYFRGVTYYASYTDVSLDQNIRQQPSVVFTGRSNSGKSSLISALCNHKNLARSSKTAGKTRMLNYYYVPRPLPEKESRGVYFVDTPGYGHASLSKNERLAIRSMIDKFFLNTPGIIMVIVVLDARRKQESEEESILMYCRDQGIPALLARTKWDTLNASEKKSARELWNKEGILPWCYPVSSTEKTGLDSFIAAIRSQLSELLLFQKKGSLYSGT